MTLNRMIEILSGVFYAHQWPADITEAEKAELMAESYVEEVDGEPVVTTLGEMEIEEAENKNQ